MGETFNTNSTATNTHTISRRNFIGAAAVGLGGMALAGLAGCAPKAANGEGAAQGEGASTSVSWDGEYDVIVCGGGGAGLTAAYSALENGAESVVVFEKGSQCGGTTALAEGAIQAAGTSWQKEKGIADDTPDVLFNFWMCDGEGLIDEDLVRTMADSAADNVQWMADNFNITYANVFGAYPTPYLPAEYLKDRIHLIADASDPTKTGGAVWITNALKAVKDKGGDVETGVEVASIVMDGSTAAGIATKDGKNYKANKGVILAMAGIEHNEELALQYNPQHYWDLKTQSVITAPTDTGDGIVMGIEAGAKTVFHGCVDLLLPTWSYTNNQNPEIPYILVNMRGTRFVREDTTYAFHCRALFNAAMQEGGADGATYMIMDKKMETSDKMCAWSDNAEGGADARKAALADGTLTQADTLEALAEAIGVPAATLSYSVGKWNEDCAAGDDTLYGRVKQLTALDEAPFYAWKTVNSNIGAIGGLKINTDAAVLSTTGEPIGHLFAAGANSAGWLGPYYPGSGTCLQGALTWGRVAGKSAATVA
ncbi:FAD-dependent oxidoreductase [Raoultibacter phocaeensis]|uniref:FAD-dependent oxidoreductase n=1 Tax=Raoultibacter phocaeensis TaxID=2479841 RepID=UPI0015D5B3E5|nr:FAD-dependent oxidoreductase [Raoultibacter phocaeensis]